MPVRQSTSRSALLAISSSFLNVEALTPDRSSGLDELRPATEPVRKVRRAASDSRARSSSAVSRAYPISAASRSRSANAVGRSASLCTRASCAAAGSTSIPSAATSRPRREANEHRGNDASLDDTRMLQTANSLESSVARASPPLTLRCLDERRRYRSGSDNRGAGVGAGRCPHHHRRRTDDHRGCNCHDRDRQRGDRDAGPAQFAPFRYLASARGKNPATARLARSAGRRQLQAVGKLVRAVRVV